MSTEDAPPVARPRGEIAQVNMVEKSCAGGCGQGSREPGYIDKAETDPTRKLKPVALPPYICLNCWIAGWRSLGPIDQQNRYKVTGPHGEELVR